MSFGAPPVGGRGLDSGSPQDADHYPRAFASHRGCAGAVRTLFRTDRAVDAIGEPLHFPDVTLVRARTGENAVRAIGVCGDGHSVPL